MDDIAGKVLVVVIAFVLLFTIPFVGAATSNEMVAKRTILNEMDLFLDETIDSRKVTENQLEDFYLAISGLGVVCDVEVQRYEKQVYPDPKGGGKISTTYVYNDNNKEYNQGDKVVLHVKAISYTGAERMLRNTVGVWSQKIDYTLAKRVR